MDPTDDAQTPPEPAAGGDTATPPAADAPAEATPPAKGDDGPKSMLDAINAGIDASGDGPPPEPKDEDGEPAPDKPAKQPAKDAPAKEGEPPKPAAAKTNGKEPPPAAAKEPKAKEPKEPKEPPGPIDPVNDPIPAEVKGRTRERMTQLISTVKEVSTERDQLRADRDEILGMIEQTGASPEQYGQALDYLAAVNSRDPARIKQAIAVAQQELAALSAMIGEPVPGVDMLGQHPDLQAEVADGKISQARAEEIAAARALRATQQQQGQRYTQQQQQQQAVMRAKGQLNRVEAELRGSDPNYEAKKAMLVPMLQPILSQLPPAQWERAFRDAYARLQLPAGTPAAHPHSNGAHREPMRAAQQPLRAMQPAGNTKREAGSMLDAINEGIEAGSRRR